MLAAASWSCSLWSTLASAREANLLADELPRSEQELLPLEELELRRGPAAHWAGLQACLLRAALGVFSMAHLALIAAPHSMTCQQWSVNTMAY